MSSTDSLTKDLYFATVTVVGWADIFTRPTYKHVILDSLDYCRLHKQLEIYAWVLMPNHLHLIVSADTSERVNGVLRDFKKFTSKKILALLLDDIQESRRGWMLRLFHIAGAEDRKISGYRFWQRGCHVEMLSSLDFFLQKLHYIHQNPVKAEIVAKPEDYLYSSAIDYAGGTGLLDVIVV